MVLLVLDTAVLCNTWFPAHTFCMWLNEYLFRFLTWHRIMILLSVKYQRTEFIS